MGAQADILAQLVELVARLYDESAGFQEDHADGQLWYNRGYANGMIEALGELGLADALHGRVDCDPEDLIAGHQMMAWGKAYLHGFEMGRKEAFEVLPSEQ